MPETSKQTSSTENANAPVQPYRFDDWAMI